MTESHAPSPQLARRSRTGAVVSALCAAAALLGSARPVAAQQAVPPAVSFAKDVKPVLAHRCYECHAKGKKKGGFSFDSRELVLKGGESGPGVVPGKSAESELINRITTNDPDLQMPPKGARLTPDEVLALRRWVDQGLKWEDVDPATVKVKIPVIAPRRVTVPPGDGNPIDRLLAPHFARHKVPAATAGTVVDDRTFARRVYLDAVGVLPTPAQLDAFLADPAPGKRERLVAALLADDAAYADHWITFWQDLLRDGKKDIGTTDIFKPITAWLQHALYTNLPYDQLVTQLITAPTPDAGASAVDEKKIESDDAKIERGGTEKTDASGYLFGAMSGLERPRGDQAWQVQAAQNIGQVFLGVNLKCATCHDSFIDRWTMEETWGFANAFSKSPIETVRCEVPTGKKSPARFVFPEVGTVDPSTPVPARQARLAELVTSPQNGRFARTIVNRLWARIMGRGIIERVDEMEGDPWYADLLDFLATDLVDHKYDLKRTIGLILSSRAYQMPAVDETRDEGAAGGGDPHAAAGEGAGYAFRGPLVKRLTAEQFVDAVYALTGRTDRVWRENGGRLLEILGRPDRRTVVTSRSSRASTIQMLELLNGSALFDLVYGDGKVKRTTADANAVVPKPGAAPKPATKPATQPTGVKATAQAKAAPAAPLSAKQKYLTDLAKLPPRDAVDRLYAHALSRKPTDREAAAMADLLGEHPTPETVADAVWVILMLPEFQLVR